jgi:hypothetical protein
MELEAEDRRSQLILTSVAAQGDKKSIQKTLKGLGGNG